MTSPKSKKPAARKKRTSRKKSSKSLFPGGINVSRILIFLALVVFFFISIAAAGYVIFFRVVVAAELPENQSGNQIKPKVAIIIDDMGNEQPISKQLLALDLNLSFSFLPHTPFLEELEASARERGRTIMLHLPLEPIDNNNDPGPGAIYLDEHTGSIEELFNENLAQVVYATGVNNHMGSKFTIDEKAMKTLVDVLLEHQLFFIDSYPAQDSRAMFVDAENRLPTSRADFFLDNVQTEAAVCERLADLVRLAHRRQSAIGIGHPHRATVEALQSCGPEILESVEVVGAGALVN